MLIYFPVEYRGIRLKLRPWHLHLHLHPRFLEGRKAERAGTDCQCDLCTKYPDNTEVHHRPREDRGGFQYTTK